MSDTPLTEEPSENPRHSLGTIATFTLLGILNGLLLGVGILVLTCSPGPGFPGKHEEMLLAALLAILMAGGGCFGFIVGFIISLPRRSR
jgi:hypothetical protein